MNSFDEQQYAEYWEAIEELYILENCEFEINAKAIEKIIKEMGYDE